MKALLVKCTEKPKIVELAEKYTEVFEGQRLFFWDSDSHKIRCIELEGGDF